MKQPRVHRMTKGGTIYKWHRITRAPLPTDIPEDHSDFIAAWNAEEAKKAPDRSRATKGTIGAAWEGLKATAAFRGYSAAYRAMVVRHGDAIATLYGAGPWETRVPIITIGVATKSRSARTLWRILHDKSPFPLATTASFPPAAPWIADRIEGGALMHPEALTWTGDFSRNLGWAWMEYDR